jgi:SAM-dependent methyltransferase
MNVSGNSGHDLMADARIHQEWVALYRTAEAQAFYEMAFDEIARRLAAPPDAKILDAGCGSCAKSILLAQRGFRVVAMDYAADALALAEGVLRKERLQDRVTLRQGDLLKLPFADGEFPYVICWGVLMHVPEVRHALAELTRVLAPGGVLVLSEGNMHSAQSIALRGLKKLIGRRRGNVARTEAGLETTEATAEGTLLTRQTNMRWLAAEGQRLGLRLSARIPGQFTELYTLAPGATLKRTLHAVNRVWFTHVGLAGPAFGNILFLQRPQR